MVETDINKLLGRYEGALDRQGRPMFAEIIENPTDAGQYLYSYGIKGFTASVKDNPLDERGARVVIAGLIACDNKRVGEAESIIDKQKAGARSVFEWLSS